MGDFHGAVIRRLKTLFPLKPAMVLALTAFLTPLFLGFAFFEYSRARKDAFHMMEQQGIMLLDALMTSGERAILAYDRIEEAYEAGLLQTAHSLRLLDENRVLTPRILQSTLEDRRLDGIAVIDREGTVQHRVEAEKGGFTSWNPAPDSLRDCIAGIRESFLFKMQASDSAGDVLLCAAVRRNRGGAIVVQAEEADLLSLRREVGPGRLMQEIGSRSGVAYAALQDTFGIRMASRGVTEMSSIRSDEFLRRILQRKSRDSRILPHGDRDVLEIAGAFSADTFGPSLFRVGLEMDGYRRILHNTRWRIFLSSLALVLVALAGIGLYLAHQDIRMISDSFRREKTHTDTILQNLEDAVAATDGGGRITVFNRAAQSLFGIRPESIIGTTADRAGFSCAGALVESLRTGKSLTRGREECTVQGERKTLSIRTSVVRGAGGSIDAVILVATDMTGESRLADQLRRQEKIKAMGEMASGVAHEIRNPINAVGMIAQRFLKEFRPERDEAEYRALAESVVREVRRVEDIVQRFLQFARSSPPVFRPLEAGRFIRETETLFKSGASAKGVAFRVDRADDSILRADGDQMKQVLLNILNNALDATSSGGSITLSGIADRDGYQIEVSDTGFGMPEEIRNRIFDLYFTTKPNGMGMGLSIAYRIVQAHGGEIEVESDRGKGTKFCIRLPREESA